MLFFLVSTYICAVLIQAIVFIMMETATLRMDIGFYIDARAPLVESLCFGTTRNADAAHIVFPHGLPEIGVPFLVRPWAHELLSKSMTMTKQTRSGTKRYSSALALCRTNKSHRSKN